MPDGIASFFLMSSEPPLCHLNQVATTERLRRLAPRIKFLVGIIKQAAWLRAK